MNKKEKIEQAFQYVEEHFSEMIREVQDVCSFRSVYSDQKGIRDTCEYITKKMDVLGLQPQILEVEGYNPLLFGTQKGNADKTLFFYNHYDVMPEGPLERWICPPYEPAIIDGKLYGRGVSDNKGGMFVRLHALEAIKATAGTLPMNVKVFVEGNEEYGSTGMKAFISKNPSTFQNMIQSDAIIWENSRNDEKNRPWASFGCGGNLTIDLSVKSLTEDAHSRMGNILPNAAWKLVWALASLKDENEHILVEHFYDDMIPVSESDKKVLEAFPYEEEETKKRYGIEQFVMNKSGYELKKRIYTEPSLTLCGIDAGDAAIGIRSVVPCQAKARLSCRLMMNQNADKIAELFKEHFKKHGFDDIEVSITGGETPIRTSTEVPIKDSLKEAATLVYEEPLVIELAQVGAGPAHLFHEACPAIPIVGIGPANTASAHHAPNENLYLEHYKNAVKMVIALLYTYAE